MKVSVIAVLLGCTSAYRLTQSNSGVWDSVVTSGIDNDDYNKSTPAAYAEKVSPKIDYEAIARKKIEAEMKVKNSMA